MYVKRSREKETYWCVRRLVVDVHESPAHVWEDLDLVLQLLADVMSFPQWCVSVHDNVNLDIVILEPPLVLIHGELANTSDNVLDHSTNEIHGNQSAESV